ncbi:uncharacterized protein TNCV_3471341 [Trichonephila clavipes]|nr:uncharacterized protein TNCV_3471341 [Trichonephila clavipes]
MLRVNDLMSVHLKRKFRRVKGLFKDYEDNFSVDTQSRYVIIDLNMLNDIFNNIAKCRYCDNSFCFDVAENKSSRKGLATSVSATCKYCGSGHTSMTSNIVSDRYEVNLRFVYGMRCIGIGKSAAQIFCAMMNLPPPPAKFERLYTPIFKALETVSSRSMVNSVNEAVIENEHNKNIAIALDGTWQKRGHTSKNGVVTATSFDNGKVIDFECLSKYCFECKIPWRRRFEGVPKGSRIKHIRDEFPVEKLECIGHVQKRMGARLRSLKNNLKSTKLSDNKPISGRGRLTDAEILLLQKYYGLAIRRNVGKSVADMSKFIWAIYFHKLSTDENPQHALCPMGEESWCGYNKSIVSGEKYTHKHSLPDAVLFKIKIFFRDITAKELLLKCLHGRTQNLNESFNNCVWNRVPKKTFVSKRTLQMGVMDAVICFNEGAYARTEVLKALKINPGVNTCEGLRKIDYVRICEAEMAVQKASKEARTTKRQIKRKQDALEQSMQDEYSAGNC